VHCLLGQQGIGCVIGVSLFARGPQTTRPSTLAGILRKYPETSQVHSPPCHGLADLCAVFSNLQLEELDFSLLFRRPPWVFPGVALLFLYFVHYGCTIWLPWHARSSFWIMLQRLRRIRR
jgi:hypothetical protein